MNMCSSELLNFNKSYMEKIYVAWRKVMRRIYKLNYRTDSYIINNIIVSEISSLKNRFKMINNSINDYISPI